MLKCEKASILGYGIFNEIAIVRKGFLKYEVIQSDGSTIAKGIKLKKYLNAPRGFICRSKINQYELHIQNPKRNNCFDIVCTWR